MSPGNNKRLVLTGASGVIGRKILEFLSPPDNCTIITRKSSDFSHLQRCGARICNSSVENTTMLTGAFHNCSCALIMMVSPKQIPTLRAFQRRVAEALFAALKSTKVKHIVHLSCIGAGRPNKNGNILGSYELERKLNWLDNKHVVHIRPAFFMEDFLQHLTYDPEKNAVQSALAIDTPLPLVSVSDVAKIAADNLRKQNFFGQTYRHIFGPQELTMAQVTATLGRLTGKKDITYQQISNEKMALCYRAQGFSTDWSAAWLSCFANLNRENNLFGKTRNLLRTSSTFENTVTCCSTELQHLFRQNRQTTYQAGINIRP